MKIYTKTGDDGTTAFFGGKRVLKNDDVVDLYGSLDELNSWIGFVASLDLPEKSKSFLISVQTDLMLISSILAGYSGKIDTIHTRIQEMEATIDIMDKKLPVLTNFIIPGGSQKSAFVHIIRSFARRVERKAVAVSQSHPIHPIILVYLNRLSDLFFVLARFINQIEEVSETVWNIPKT